MITKKFTLDKGGVQNFMKKKLIFVSLICLFLDQLMKSLLHKFLYVNQTIEILPFFSITYVRNEGAAWSLFTGRQFLLILMSFIALILLYYYFVKNKKINSFEQMSYGILFGGILGNLMDRIIRGYVIDFFDFKIGSYAFPVFNFADICIVIGIFFVILFLWKEEKNGTDCRTKSKTD